MSLKTCIINYAHGAWHPRGQARLLKSLDDTGFSDTRFAWQSHEDLGCPSHQEVPYAFKPYALEHANSTGYKLVLWCDASVWAIKSLQPVFDHLACHSHLFFYVPYGGSKGPNNNNIGTWTSDACLQGFNLNRDLTMDIPMLVGGCFGLNLTTFAAQEFLHRWLEKSKDGFSFPGAWDNKQQQVSKDPRCLGHRHDQSVASIIAHALGMEYTLGTDSYFSYLMPDMKDSVSLVCQGM
jgi:hypothetical protein